jgi:hypothetical protein
MNKKKLTPTTTSPVVNGVDELIEKLEKRRKAQVSDPRAH